MKLKNEQKNCKLNIADRNVINPILAFLFYTSWKHQKKQMVFSGGIKWKN